MYTIRDLMALTGLSLGVIRYCVRTHLIAPPTPARGARARYGNGQLDRLRRIADFRAKARYYRPAVRRAMR